MQTLEEVHQRRIPFIVQYTINGYPRELESRVVDPARAIDTFRSVSSKFGMQSVVWRYDTIVFSTLTSKNFHLSNFSKLAAELSGYTDEVVVSFMQLYRKTRLNLDRVAQASGFAWHDPPSETKKALLEDLVEIASGNGIRVSICTQSELTVPGAGEARCVDAERLMTLAGRPFRTRLKGMRTGCGCYESRDIGDYDTCPHGCVYCYAVRDRSTALQRYRDHDPSSEYLFPQKVVDPSSTELADFPSQQQLSLLSLPKQRRDTGENQ